MKINKRQQKIAGIVNRIFFVDGWDAKGDMKQQWIVLPSETHPDYKKMKLKLNSSINEVKKMKLKLNSSIEGVEKMKLKLNSSIQPKLGDLVTHSEHPLGLGLVVEKHPEYKAFKVNWIDQPSLTLFIDEKVLIPINKEHAHESDDL